VNDDIIHYNRFHTLLRGIILYGFAMLFLSLIVTGHLVNYIAPKMNPLFYTATVIFFLLSIIQMVRSFPKAQAEAIACQCGTDHHPKGSLLAKLVIYGIFILPILTGFLLPHKMLDSAVAEKRGVQLSLGSQLSAAKSTVYTDSNKDKSNENENASFKPVTQASQNKQENTSSVQKEDVFSAAGYGDYYANLARNLYKQDVIELNDQNYLESLTVINLFLPQFVGKKMDVKGFVYRGEDTKLAKDQMVVARFAVTCCTADASVAGILTQGDMTKSYKPNTWVDIRGTIQKKDFKTTALPMIQLDHIEKIPSPKNPYVY
jgi:putative membrane protein